MIKMKAMISQPMNGLTDEQILAVKAKAVKSLEEKGYEVVNTFFEDFKGFTRDGSDLPN